MSEKTVTLRGGVMGFSMWPNLIPGDILRAEMKSVSLLCAGMIAVFQDPGSETKIVHRVLSTGNSGNMLVVVSGGDRSGRDSVHRCLSFHESIPVVNGVLRRGRYRKVGSVKIPQVLSPLFVVRNHCRIVRGLQW